MIIKHLLLWFLILVRMPWTVARFIKAYSYALHIDRRVSHNGLVTLKTEAGEISYFRGKGLTFFKFIGAFRDRR